MAKGPRLAYIRRTMASRALTIEKTFPVQTRNQLLFPKGYRANRRYPLLVALHGMGMSAEEFVEILTPLRELPIAVFVPDGVYPFEIRAGGSLRIGRGWYLYTGDEERFVRSMQKSGRHLNSLVNAVTRDHGLDPERMALLGFSQGGYFAGYHGIRYAKRYRGLSVIGARVKDEVLEKEMRKAKDLSVLLQHGRKDRAVPLRLAEQSLKALEGAGVPVELKTYDCGHSVTRRQLTDTRAWLKKVLGLRG